MPRFAHMDTETTGLHAGRKPWEVALIIHDCDDTDYRKLLSGVERHQFFVHPADLDWPTVDPKALEIGDFRGRHPHGPLLEAAYGRDLNAIDYGALQKLPSRIGVARLAEVAESVHRRTQNKTLICGSNPHFDMETLAPAIEAISLKPGWHYHPVDIPSMCEGYLFGKYGPGGLSVERKSEALAKAVGVDLTRYERHTAMGDCELFYAAWKKVVGI